VAIAGEDGLAVVGLRRDAPQEIRISARMADSDYEAVATIEVLPREDAVSKFTMECNKIAAQSPEEKRHAELSWVTKDKALKVFASPVASLGLVKPAEGPYSSPYGAVRTYVPKTKDCEGRTSVHNGQDIAIATGTELRAPMGGTVLLADPDLYYEGGAVFLDHGRGLMSVLMHMSRIDVANGAVVQQGDVLGLSGSTGRVTGPHLHWAIKYRNVHSDDRGTDIWLDPVLMMNLALPQ
jgi:murein DD-endopeptidase MepM/ murein hydrolase activator NlpD